MRIPVRTLIFVLVMLLFVFVTVWLSSMAHAQVQPGPNISPNGVPFTYAPRHGGSYLRRPPSHIGGVPAVPGGYIMPAPFVPPPLPPVAELPPPPPVEAPPPVAPPPPQPIGWVWTRGTVCPNPASCPVVFVSVAADGLNVRPAGPDSPPIMALVNGTPLVVLDRRNGWTLVAPACDLTPTFLFSWTAGVPLNRCWVY